MTAPPSLSLDAEPVSETRPVTAPRHLIATPAIVAASTLALAACGGGSDGEANPDTGVPEPDGAGPSLPDTRSLEETALFLGQATLGAGRAEIQALARRPLNDWLTEQFALPPTSSHVAWLYANGYDAEEFRYSQRGMDNTVWRAFIGGADALRQRVVKR